jgi:hypothetical protein
MLMEDFDFYILCDAFVLPILFDFWFDSWCIAVRFSGFTISNPAFQSRYKGPAQFRICLSRVRAAMGVFLFMRWGSRYRFRPQARRPASKFLRRRRSFGFPSPEARRRVCVFDSPVPISSVARRRFSIDFSRKPRRRFSVFTPALGFALLIHRPQARRLVPFSPSRAEVLRCRRVCSSESALWFSPLRVVRPQRVTAVFNLDFPRVFGLPPTGSAWAAHRLDRACRRWFS